MATSAGDKSGPQRPDVFISYSRKDSEFVRRLEKALESRGREAWVDWEGIQPAEEFMRFGLGLDTNRRKPWRDIRFAAKCGLSAAKIINPTQIR